MAAAFAAQSCVAALLTLIVGVAAWLPMLASKGGFLDLTTQPFWVSLLCSAVIGVCALGTSFDSASSTPWRCYTPIRWRRLIARLAVGRWGTLFALFAGIPAWMLLLGDSYDVAGHATLGIAALWVACLVSFSDSAGARRVAMPFVRWVRIVVTFGPPLLLVVLLVSGPLGAIGWLYPPFWKGFGAVVDWICGVLDSVVDYLRLHPVGVGLLVVASPTYPAFAWRGENGSALLLWTGLYFAALAWQAARSLRDSFAANDDALEAAAFEEYLERREEFQEAEERLHEEFEEVSEKRQIETTEAIAALAWPQGPEERLEPEEVLFRRIRSDNLFAVDMGTVVGCVQFVGRHFLSFLAIACACTFILGPASWQKWAAMAVLMGFYLEAVAGIEHMPAPAPGLPARWPCWVRKSVERRVRPRMWALAVLAACFWAMAGTPMAGVLAAIAYPLAVAAGQTAHWAEDVCAARASWMPRGFGMLAAGAPPIVAAILAAVSDAKVNVGVGMEDWVTFAPIAAVSGSILLASLLILPSVLRRGTDMVTGSHAAVRAPNVQNGED